MPWTSRSHSALPCAPHSCACPGGRSPKGEFTLCWRWRKQLSSSSSFPTTHPLLPVPLLYGSPGVPRGLSFILSMPITEHPSSVQLYIHTDRKCNISTTFSQNWWQVKSHLKDRVLLQKKKISRKKYKTRITCVHAYCMVYHHLPHRSLEILEDITVRNDDKRARRTR